MDVDALWLTARGIINIVRSSLVTTTAMMEGDS
jgi:hypothetical protein